MRTHDALSANAGPKDIAIQRKSAVLASVGNTPLALALGYDGIETKLWLISQNRDAFNQKD